MYALHLPGGSLDKQVGCSSACLVRLGRSGQTLVTVTELVALRPDTLPARNPLLLFWQAWLSTELIQQSVLPRLFALSSGLTTPLETRLA